MGISCEISLFPSADGKYEYAPGGIVSGAIKYFLHEEYMFTTITVSLKGQGRLKYVDKRRRREEKKYRYRREESYVDDDVVIYINEKEEPFQTGQYETPFSFQLPQDLPPSLTLSKNNSRYKLWCNIMYYVRIKFERPGFFNASKHFKKEIKVTSGGIPRLETKPLQYSVDKSLLKLKSLFSSNKEKVTMKGTINTSVVRPGETIKVDFEIENGTSVEIKSVKVKLIQVDKYRPRGHYDVVKQTDIDGSYYKYGNIKAGETMSFLSDIAVPDHCGSICHSKMISRDYAVEAIVVLPMPHINLKLEIPVQVMDKVSTHNFNASMTVPEYPTHEGLSEYPTAGGSSNYPRDNPPSYWEAMGEEVKQKFDSDDDDDGFDDEEKK